ncbi:MAG: HEAT repeat domain-containing protein [Desulfarculaceae bacterium]|nr:HEAT repeat domain-containing protein [Desulfarculaceae bacterium]MCF8048854.1 HEAT repeat domain-containing protein [Desulfarculaceae bacterium]MCF8065945.1 HEAT repeat domain-containing protein [Desulfarculaceae bacterium]MCF8098746.1 HEAT repeat domain-containing protein [Desulfarculaceae bacterium]MCF8123970.1 HEAT repeat domain-containing protein [Desulfarculaceae bacterium]
MAGKTGSRRRVRALLAADDFEASLRELKAMPPEQALKYLQAGLPAAQPVLKWRAVTALGQVVQGMAARDLDGVRDFLRRLMWCLNEESGAVPWGVAEALGEILAHSLELAKEYANIQLSYIWSQGNFLEFGPLLSGAVWGVGRLASAHPELARGCCALERLVPLLAWPEASVRGTAAWALGHLGDGRAVEALRELADDQARLEIWDLGVLRQASVAGLAGEAINKLVN